MDAECKGGRRTHEREGPRQESGSAAQRAVEPISPVKRLAVWVATGFGLGWSPVASGTAGTLLGVALVWLLPWTKWQAQLALSAGLILVAIPACSVAEREFGVKDDSRIVADEYTTFPLCLVGLPWGFHPWLLLTAFVVHRVLDIVKPFPAYRLQRLRGGAGIVADDVASSLYALGANHLLVALFPVLLAA